MATRGSDFEQKPLSAMISEAEARLTIAMQRQATSILEELTSDSDGVDDDDIPDGEDPFEDATVDQIRALIESGKSLSKTPWGNNAKNNRAYYIADTGHVYTVKPKSEGDQEPPTPEAKAASRRVQAALTKWMDHVGWSLRQAEVSKRLDETGECFDLLFYDDGGHLELNFVEPGDLDEDAKSDFNDAEDTDKPFTDDLGVRRTNNILYRPVAYFVDNDTATGQWIGDLDYYSRPANGADGAGIANYTAETDSLRSLCQRRRRNVTSGDPRGLHLYYPCRRELRWAKVLLGNVMRVSGFQAAFGAIRTILNGGTRDAAAEWLASQQGGTKSSGSETYNMDAPGVVTVPATIKYEFPETGAGATNHIEVLVQLLRACASGMMLPEFMLTANVSEGNFASTLVSEGPFHKGMKYEQSLMVAEDMRIIWQALKWGALTGALDISLADLEQVTIEAKPPRVQTRNRKEDFEIGLDLWKNGRISGKTLNKQEGYEYEEEQSQIALERKSELPPPLNDRSSTGTPGPNPDGTGDPMKEKGVLAGDPSRQPAGV